jgi:hypothetical protein
MARAEQDGFREIFWIPYKRRSSYATKELQKMLSNVGLWKGAMDKEISALTIHGRMSKSRY